MKDQQSGETTLRTELVSLILVILIMGVLLYFMMHVEQPYIWVVDYIYKSNYYKEFKLPTGYDEKTQGRNWSNWDTDETGIQKICNLFNESAGYINENPKTKASKQCLMLWEEWIVAFLDELEHTDVVNPGFQGFPWGKNWYQFTISAPTNLAYYIVNKNSSGAIKTVAAKAIQYLIIDPEHSLGYTRDKANSAMMLFPWTLSHMITGTLDTTNVSYQYAIQQYDLRPNKNIRANEDGIHLDYSYLTHNGVYAFGYLDSINSIYPDTQQVIPEVSNMNLDYHMDMIHSKLWHPTIPLSGSTLFHRGRDRRCSLYKGKTKTPKAVIMPSMRYIRVFDDTYQWSIRVGSKTIAYYECDQVVYDMGLYSCLCKQAYYQSDDPSIAPFPQTGFIYDKSVTKLPEVDPNPTGKPNPTTQPYYVNPAQNLISTMFIDYDEQFAYYNIVGIEYNPLFNFHFDETGYVDIKNDTFYYWMALQKDKQASTKIYWVNKEYLYSEIPKATNKPEVIQCTYNFKNKTGTVGPSTQNAQWTPNITNLNPRYKFWMYGSKDFNFIGATSVPKEDAYFIYFKDDKPFIYVNCDNDIMTDTMVGVANGNTYKFNWNVEWNQYLWENYVIQKPIE